MWQSTKEIREAYAIHIQTCKDAGIEYDPEEIEDAMQEEIALFITGPDYTQL